MMEGDNEMPLLSESYKVPALPKPKLSLRTEIIRIAIIIVTVGVCLAILLRIPKTVTVTNLYDILAVNGSISGTNFARLVLSGLNAPKFQIAYVGNATFIRNGVQTSWPLNISISKYYNNTRVTMNLGQLPAAFGGVGTIISIKNGTKYYSCSQLFGNAINAFSSNYTCTNQAKIGSINNLFITNSSLYSNAHSQLYLTSVAITSYNGMSCTVANGRFVVSLLNLNSVLANLTAFIPSINKNSSTATLTFSTCISDTARVPLTLSINFNSTNTTTNVALREVYFVGNSSKSITALPGKLINYSLANQTFISQCLTLPIFTCSTPVMTVQGNLEVALGQSSGQAFYNTELACTSASNLTLAQITNLTYFGLQTPQIAFPSSNAFYSGEQLIINKLPCTDQNGNVISLQSGSLFKGQLWMNYTKTQAQVNQINPWLTQKVGVIIAKVV